MGQNMKQRFVSFHYVVKNNTGKVLDSSLEGEPMIYLEGANQIMSSLEEEMKPLRTGEKKQITVSSAKAYGIRDEKLIIEVSLNELPKKEKIKEGLRFRLDRKGVDSMIYRVLSVTSTHAILDGNHPLAGLDLTFDVEIKEIREASTADVQYEGNEAGPSRMNH